MNNITKKYLDELNIKKEIKSLDDITTLIKCHVNTFAFSSLKVLLEDEISLDLNCIFEDIVIKKRGGYCFEHNKLMYEILKDLGFEVEYYLARVVNNSDNEVPQTHRFTLLNYKNKRFIIDVGIGFNTPSVLVDFQTPTVSSQGFIYKVLKQNNAYLLQKIKDEEIYTVTSFDLNPCFEADFEMGHFYSHKHPCAVFVNNLVLSLITDIEIRSLRNNVYLKIYENRNEEIDISSLDKFSNVLKNDFNLNFSDNEIKTIFEKYVKDS